MRIKTMCASQQDIPNNEKWTDANIQMGYGARCPRNVF